MADSPVPTSQAPAPAPAPAPAASVVSPPSGAEILAKAAEAKAAQDQMLQSMEIVPPRRSESIAKLALALSKAQGKIVAAKRQSANPFFKSKYADLAAIWEACRGALSENEIAVFQPASARGRVAIITTIIVHSSGEFLEEALMMVAERDSPQAVGSTITYGRRYGLASMVGVATEDDDGQAAENQLPKDTKWDRGQTGRHQTVSGVSDDLPETPEASGSAEGLAGSGGPVRAGAVAAPSPPSPATPPPAPLAPKAGSPVPSAAAPIAVARPGGPPPPPGRPPARAPGAPEKPSS